MKRETDVRNQEPTVLLVDIGNTHVHLGWGTTSRVRGLGNLKTREVLEGILPRAVPGMPRREWDGASLCSVVPKATPILVEWLRKQFGTTAVPLTSETARGIGIDYPRPRTIGADRLANAIAATARFGAPVVVVDFGTAVTFDVVRKDGCYVGGIIAPGLSLMTDYLHEKTALLPAVKIAEPRSVIGRSTVGAMQAGAVHGYRGLVKELIAKLKAELGAPRLPVVATGGYAGLIAKGVPEICEVVDELTLEGLFLNWHSHSPRGKAIRGGA